MPQSTLPPDSHGQMPALNVLETLITAVSQSLDTERVIHDALDAIMGLFQCSSTHIRLMDDTTQELVVIAQRGYSADELAHLVPRRKYGEGLSAILLASGEVFVIEDINADPRYGMRNGFAHRIGTRSLIYFPLRAKEKILGDIVVHYKTPRTYAPEEIRLFAAIGHLIGTVIENARCYRDKLEEIAERKHAEEALRKSEKAARGLAQENELMAEIGRIIGSTLNVAAVYERFAEKVRGAISFERIVVSTINRRDDTRTVRYCSGSRVPDDYVGTVLPIAGTKTEEVLRTKATLLITSENNEDLRKRFPASVLRFGAPSTAMLVPLISHDEVIGILTFQSAGMDAYSGHDLRLAERVAAQIAGAIANAQLFLEREQAEERLRESEERYRSLVSATDWSFLVDRDCRYLFANEHYLDNFGPLRDSVLGAKYGDFHDRERTRVFTDAVRYVLETGRVYQGEYWGTKSRAYYLQKLSPVRNTDGSITAVTVISTDITERKEAEEALQRSNERHQTILRTAMDGIWRTDREGRLLEVNESYCRMSGYSERELLTMRIGDLEAVETADDTANHMQQVIARGEDRFETRHRRKDGSILDVEVSVQYRPEDGGQLVAFFHDITERKEAEAALRESESKFRSVAEQSIVGISILQDGVLQYVNPRYAEMHGYRVEEMIGMPYGATVHPDDRPFVAEIVRKRLAGEIGSSHYECRKIKRDGEPFYVEIYGVPSRYHNRPAVIGVLLDLTDRKRLEGERLALLERLNRSEKMEALGTLAGGVAHDMNNILGVLSGYSELLQETLPEGSPQKSYARNILSASEKGAAIIQDLLTLARRGVPASEVMNINRIVADFLRSPLYDKIHAYHAEVRFATDLAPDLMNIKGSAIHLEKTVMNLVLNAVESSPGRGTVTIRTENRYLDKPVHGYEQVREGDYVVLVVSDGGGGIPNADLDKIFEPFYTKKKMGRSGTGLGLAIVWGTVKDHEGYIDVESIAGQGSTFTLYFPVTREEISAEQKAIPVEQYRGKGEHILVVDDVSEQRDVAVSILSRLGYQVHAVASGEEAVEYLKGAAADILVLDMIMDPGIDGLETYKRIIALHPRQKAVIVSGFSETDRVLKTQALGAGAYVKKPYLKERIGMAVRRELDRDRPGP